MKCENCHGEHDGSYGSGRFCSFKCKQSWLTKRSNKSNKHKCILTCEVCGTDFVAGQGKKLIILDKFKMVPYCEYVAKKYGLSYKNYANDFWKLYDHQDSK